MIFQTKEAAGHWTQDAPACPFNGRPCLMKDCAAFEWFTPIDGKKHNRDHGYCGLTRGASFADGRPRFTKE